MTQETTPDLADFMATIEFGNLNDLVQMQREIRPGTFAYAALIGLLDRLDCIRRDAALTNPTDCCAKTREACAKVAEEHFADEHWNSAYAAAGHSIATAIRKGADT